MLAVFNRARPFAAGAVGLIAIVHGLAGCRTTSPAPGSRLNREDTQFAQALAHYSEGLMLEGGRQLAPAAEAFDQARRLDPDGRKPVDALVLKRLQQERPGAALDELEAFCRNHPDDVAAHRDLARLAELGGDFSRAARHYGRAFRLAPEDRTLAYGCVRALFEGGADRDALRAMRRLAQRQPDNDARALSLHWAVRFARREHAPARALPCLDLAIALATGQPQRVSYRLFEGDVALAAGRTNAAIRAWQTVLDDEPDHVQAALALAHARYASEGAAAIRQQARRTPSDSRHPADLLVLAGLHLAARDRTNAAPALARAEASLRAENRIPSADLALLRGSVLDELGRHDEAAQVFRQGLQNHPHAHVVMNYLAYMWSLEGKNLAEAERLSRASLRYRPTSGAYLDTLGWICFKQGRVDEALGLLMHARAAMPDDPTVLEHLGDVLLALKREPEALAFWRRSYALDREQSGVGEKLRAHGVDPAGIPHLPPQEPPADETSGSGDDDP